MADNTLTAIQYKILARGLMSLRKRAIMPRLVNGSYNGEAAQKGAIINVPVPTGIASAPVVPSNVPPVTGALTPVTVPIALNMWQQAAFKLSDKDLIEIDRNQSFMPMEAEEAVASLANDVNADIMSKYKGIYGATGSAGTAPFASTVEGATLSRKILNLQRCPRDSRRMVMDYESEANALALAQFADLEKTGDPAVKIEGEIGRKYGFDMYTDDDVPLHTAGAPGAGPIRVDNGAGYPAGTTALHIDGLTVTTGTLKEGDIVTFAGDDQTYVVTADKTADGSGDVDLTIAPGLKIGVANDVVITHVLSHVVNLAFHRDAFAVAVRPLENSILDAKLANITSLTDPQTGLSMRLELTREHKQWVWRYDILWGSGLVRPELACRILG